MKVKKSSYQKLKEENHKLWQDLYKIVMKPDETETLYARVYYKIRFETEKAIWFGDSNLKNDEN